MTNLKKAREFKKRHKLGFSPGEVVQVSHSTDEWTIINRMIDITHPTYMVASGKRTGFVRMESIKRVTP